ncbi:MAG TPA: DAK2 domain-containing protein [Chloroflexota bacterium]|nr:DAK2 domain-containing protein [Chloroflexota bacterium]
MKGAEQAEHGRCGGRHLRAVVDAAAAWLLAHAHEVDALNVYPVPDGDTGSNMSETMRAATAEAARGDEASAGALAAALAHGALMGARGNSGVILSQLLRGFAHSLGLSAVLTPAALALALQEASDTAYRAVMRPVEGTVLTVARVVAEEAARAAAERSDYLFILDRALRAGRIALAETQNQLPALQQAGVVDAGGSGYLFLLEGALRHLQGKTAAPATEVPETPAASRAFADLHARLDHFEGGYGYCTEFLVVGGALDEQQARAALAALGDSLLVVGGDDLLRVHIHTQDPGRALSYASGLGRLRRVKVQDMSEQFEEFAGEQPAAAPTGTGDPLPVGIVAVAPGAGFGALFESLGAVVVAGGQSMNPSTEEILDAVARCPQAEVVVLPNNKNVLLTAQQAADLSGKTTHVLPTRTVPQGIAALLAVRFDQDPTQILADMGEAAGHVRTAELTIAVRDAEIEGLAVHTGDTLGLLDGDLVSAGPGAVPVLADLLARMPADRYEVATIYRGRDATDAQNAELLAFLRTTYPDLQIEEQSGDQAHYHFVLSVE